MGHFYKKLILSGIFAVATAGLFNTAGASALGFLDSEFTNPFGLESAPLLEPAQPSSTDDSIPTLLYNRISDGETLWGYEGEGIVFADSDGLVDGNPHLKTAKRGDTLSFSVKIEPERYYDDAETEPFSTYTITASLSQGLTLDYDSIVLRINDQVISDEDVSVEQVNGELGLSYYLRKTITFSQTSQGTTTFNYPEGAAIELTYSATIDSDAPSQLFSRAGYSAYTNNYSKIISSGSVLYGGAGYQLDVMLDGNIVIRRVDTNNQPLAGAKYIIDGVKANADHAVNGTYTYDSNGSVSEFVTDKDGVIVINGVPFGTYTAKEVSSPTGYEVLVSTISKNLEQDIREIETGKLSYRMNLYDIDITSSIIDSDQGKMVPYPELSAFMGGSSGEIIATMDESQGGYSFNGGVVKKTANGYQLLLDNAEPVDFVYDSTLNKYLARINNTRNNNLQLTINGDQATFVTGDQPNALFLNNETGCYEGVLQEENATITMCSDGESGYYFIEEMALSSGSYHIGVHCVYDEGVDGYVESSSAIISIEEESDSELRLLGNYPIVVIPQIGAHYMFMDETLWLLNTAPQTVLGTEFLFREKTSGSGTMPEDIVNPQTGDAFLKSITIAAIGTLPLYIVRKRLTRRVN